jgi:hypothetical protein
MPVTVLYETREFSRNFLDDLTQSIAEFTAGQLAAKIEVRVVQTVYAYNANELHLEMRFRDFGDWTDEQLAKYHAAVMTKIGDTLGKHGESAAYSFYVLPSVPPRSLWDQGRV